VGGYVLAGTVTDTEFHDTSLLSGTTYLYKVCAYLKTSSMVLTSAQTSAISVKTTGEVQRTGVVKASSLNIRSDATTSASIVATAQNGQAVLVLETLTGWYKVQFTVNGITYTGYASADYIVLDEIKPVCPYAEPTVTLKKGDKGDGVKWLQWYLSQLGYLSESDIDGDFGGKTDTAVKSFQTAQGLTVDGIVGSGTRTALKNML
jgi:murein L,D-transpeptidase YcbB/YkuD